MAATQISPKIKIDGKELSLSHLDKVLYPATGFTKAEVIDYYARVAKFILPHLKNRSLTLKRYPDGVDKSFFYEKECPRYRPPWMATITAQRTKEEGVIHYCAINDAASLVWIANLASIELHVLLSKGPRLSVPTAVAFDLDPGPGSTILDCIFIGLKLRGLFEQLGLQSFAKTTGKKGLHLYIPLNTPTTFEATKTFAHNVAMAMERQFPDKVVSRMQKVLRSGKVLLDWSQNDSHKTTVVAYSLRAADTPTVSTPVNWEELEHALKQKDPNRLVFRTVDVLRRLKKSGDLFSPVLTLKQKLPAPLPDPAEKSEKPIRNKKALKTYQAKRDFGKTPEPQGGPSSPKGKERFVIQKHAASHLHYDFRLESSGVLKSWAVPKGPSTHIADKRLAMMTEDHPMDYARFEGTIPKGEYGGGTVMVWDEGTYVNLTQNHGKLIPFAAGLAKGHVDFWLNGKKLHGGWSLVRLGQDPRKWLLVKMKDAGANYPPDPVSEKPDSVLTRRSLEEIAGDKKSPVWHSNRA